MKKVLRFFAWPAAILLGFILQGSVLPSLALGGITPNLMLILVVASGMLDGPYVGMGVGFLTGILCDICFMDVLGFYALIYVLTGYLTGRIGALLFVEDYKYSAAAVAAADFLYTLYCFTFRFLFRNRLYAGYFFLHFGLPEILYTAILSIPLFPLIVRLHGRIRGKEQPHTLREGPYA